MNCSRLSLPGLYGAILALAVQLAAAALVLQPALATLENGVICHTDASKLPAPVQHHTPDLVL
jgi:hypothetical protein